MSSDKSWAKEYVLDPLTAPQPADETGPGTHFRPEPEDVKKTGSLTPPKSAARPKDGAITSSVTVDASKAYPSPRQSPSHRQEAFSEGHRRSRGSSLGERFPGDMSHRPLDQLTQEKAVADKSRHVMKKHHINPDQVDLLDATAAGGAYHHSGPYDATLFARNNSYKSSPVNAVSGTNAEALKATPKEKVVDSLVGHRPLDGVATYAPGEVDPNGNEYNYQPGDNMMVDGNPEGGAYRRWPGVDYHPDDIKGKGEPSYSLEKALKKKDDSSEKGTEMSNHFKSDKGDEYGVSEVEVRRSDSISKRLSGGLKRRIGSLKRTS